MVEDQCPGSLRTPVNAWWATGWRIAAQAWLRHHRARHRSLSRITQVKLPGSSCDGQDETEASPSLVDIVLEQSRSSKLERIGPGHRCQAFN